MSTFLRRRNSEKPTSVVVATNLSNYSFPNSPTSNSPATYNSLLLSRSPTLPAEDSQGWKVGLNKKKPFQTGVVFLLLICFLTFGTNFLGLHKDSVRSRLTRSLSSDTQRKCEV